jgi:CRISPR-associated protein Csm3
MARRLIKKVNLFTTFTLISGLHIGDSKDNVEIGGVDNPVVRRKDNQQPYIPGSSIKGKIRCLLEQIRGVSRVGGANDVNQVFGIADRDNTIASKIIFRDAYLCEESKNMLLASPNTDMPYTELKFENSIDRVKGKADHPRQQERVPAGTKFNVHFTVNIFDDEETLSITMLKEGLKALENDYLGGSGSRGYGQLAIDWDLFEQSLSKKENTILFNKDESLV